MLYITVRCTYLSTLRTSDFSFAAKKTTTCSHSHQCKLHDSKCSDQHFYTYWMLCGHIMLFYGVQYGHYEYSQTSDFQEALRKVIICPDRYLLTNFKTRCSDQYLHTYWRLWGHILLFYGAQYGHYGYSQTSDFQEALRKVIICPDRYLLTNFKTRCSDQYLHTYWRLWGHILLFYGAQYGHYGYSQTSDFQEALWKVIICPDRYPLTNINARCSVFATHLYFWKQSFGELPE